MGGGCPTGKISPIQNGRYNQLILTKDLRAMVGSKKDSNL